MLAEWIESSYCRAHGITKDTVAEVVRQALGARAAQPAVGVDRREGGASETVKATRVIGLTIRPSVPGRADHVVD